VVWSRHAHGRREDTKEDAGDEVEVKKTKRQAKNQVDGPSNERCRKRGKKWTQVKQDKEWEDRDRWRFLCNSRPKKLETT
jgi:hypothetical protein